MNLFDLTNKIAVVTGGYGHLGSEMVRVLLQFNATVVVAGRSIDKYHKCFEDIKNDSLHFISTDITKTDSINQLFNGIESKFGKLDVLINNAHTTKGNSQEQMSDDDWNYTMEGVLGSVHKCIRAALPLLKESDNGKIINITSMYGMVSPDFRVYENSKQYTNPPHYGAAKAGIIQLTRYYAAYLGKFNICVNSISPGPFPNRTVQNESPDFIEALKGKNPLHKIGEPHDIAGATILLSSNASNFITGHNLVVDGGWTSW